MKLCLMMFFLIVILILMVIPNTKFDKRELDFVEKRPLATLPKLIVDGEINKEFGKQFENFYNKDVKIIVGHSAGAGFMLKYLQQNPKIKLAKLIFVAPWLDIEKECADFLNFQMKNDALNNIKEISLFYSTDDEKSILDSVDKILSHYKNIKVHSFENKGHFVYNTIGSTFPELWKVITE